MRRQGLLLTVLLFMSLGAFSQEKDYYWYQDEKVSIEKVPGKSYVLLEGIEDQKELERAIDEAEVEVVSFGVSDLSSKIEPYQNKALTPQKWAILNKEEPDLNLASKPFITYETPFYQKSEEKPSGLSQYFYVKLKAESDLSKLEELAAEVNVEILGNNKFMPRWYTLACNQNSEGSPLAMANYFYETEFFEASEPAWMVDYQLNCNENCHSNINDPNFGDQWGLENQGQYGSSYDGSDINWCPARQVTEGSGITVAVIDHGVEQNHPDLGIVDPGYDCQSGTTPSQVRGSHGTACAGIIGAQTNNTIGVAGVAPDVEILPVSHDLYLSPTASQELANGINWAWQNGADVLSNSWGHSQLQSSMLDDAIDQAFNQGRNGKGCVVAFASGNNDNSSTLYPANSDSRILNVGALSPCEERKNPSSCDNETHWGSNYGSELDIVAPGVKIPTTDRQGASGYASGDYYLEFNGTSSATPHVAGVAALLLSEEPTLTHFDVEKIISSNAQKFGSYNYTNVTGRPHGTWNQEMGYGALDAAGALEDLSNGKPKIDNIKLSHICWESKNKQGNVVVNPAELTVYPYGGSGEYEFTWETYNRNQPFPGCSYTSSIKEQDWILAGNDLDDPYSKSPKVINAIQNPQTGPVVFRVTVKDKLTCETVTKTICWNRKDHNSDNGRLVIRESINDIGNEPNDNFSDFHWKSPDIWNRYQADNQVVHLPLSTQTDNYTYYRVRNMGCKPTDPAELFYYWTHGNTSFLWDAGYQPTNGDIIGSDNISKQLNPGEIYYDYIKHSLPSHANHGHACILGRIYKQSSSASKPWGKMLNSNGWLEQKGVHPWSNLKNFRNITARNTDIVNFIVDEENGETIRDNSLTTGLSPLKIHWGKVNRNYGGTQLIIERGSPTYGLIHTDLETGPGEFNEVLGDINLRLGDNLQNVINSQNVRTQGLRIEEGDAVLESFPSDSNEAKTGIYNLNLAEVGDNLEAALTFQVSDNTNYPSPGYYIYNVIRRDYNTENERYEKVGEYTYIATVAYDSAKTALATDPPDDDFMKKTGSDELTNEDRTKASSIQVSPNPFNNTFQVTGKEDLERNKVDVVVFNLQGQKVYQKEGVNLKNDGLNIDASAWRNGGYLIQVRHKGSLLETETIIKQ